MEPVRCIYSNTENAIEACPDELTDYLAFAIKENERLNEVMKEL